MTGYIARTKLTALKANRAVISRPVGRFRKLRDHPSSDGPLEHRLTRGRVSLLVALVDAVAVMGGTALTLYETALNPRSPPGFASISIIAALISLLLAYKLGAYLPDKLSSTRHRVRCWLLAILAAGLIMTFSFVFTSPFDFSTKTIGWTAMVGLSCVFSSALTAATVRRFCGALGLKSSVAIVGSEAESRWLVGRLLQGGADSVHLIGIYDDRWGSLKDVPDGIARAPGLDELLVHSRKSRVDAIIFTMPGTDYDRIARARYKLGSTVADIFLAAKELDMVAQASRGPGFHPDLLVRILSRPLTDWQMFQKSLLDRILTPVLCLLVMPVFCLAAIAIRLDSPGPILFRQVRRGVGNTTFRVFKFRTMYVHMTDADATQQTTRNDQRITRVGRFLRKISLDEVPQLLNVLRGEMSLVGPRPHALNTKAGDQLFPDAVAEYRLRYRVKPGITGWAQINGWRGETRNLQQLEQRVLFDLAYIENWSLQFDIKIIVMTLIREVNSKIAF